MRRKIWRDLPAFAPQAASTDRMAIANLHGWRARAGLRPPLHGATPGDAAGPGWIRRVTFETAARASSSRGPHPGSREERERGNEYETQEG